MNAELLLAHYEKIADAPDAIQRLRRFTLDLAVRGKLVPQDPAEEPASELLRRATSDRSRTTLQESRTDKHEATEPGYDLPPRWLWVRIGDHLELINGMAFKPTDWKQSGIKIVRIQNLNRLDAPFNYCDPEDVKDRFLIDDGAFLISWSGTPGTSFGAFIWDRGKAVLNQHIFRCAFRLHAFDQRYLRLAINGRLDEMIAKAHGGVGLQHITKGKLEALLIALPPLAEQHRIVAKVDQLMALCDRLEEARAKREETRDRLTAASLARLNAPDPDPATFANHARFALNALPAITTRPDQIKQLRQTILNLAVRGKLVPQDPNDEPASELLKRIFNEKARLVKSGEIRKQSPQPPICDDECPFELPSAWSWVRLGDLIHLVSGQHLQPPEYSNDPCAGLPYITGPSDFAAEGLQITRFALVRKAVAKKGQLLLTVKGSGVGKTTICDIPEVAISRQLMALTAIAWDDRFLLLVTHRLAEKLQAEARSLIPGISREDVERFVFPLPPLAEQRRIVAKVDDLMALCDQLEASLTTSDDTRRRLLDALLAEALTTHERQDKAA